MKNHHPNNDAPCAETAPATDRQEKRPKLTADGYMAAAQSQATKHGYATDVRHFCDHGGTIPATPEQVIAYIVSMLVTHPPPSTPR